MCVAGIGGCAACLGGTVVDMHRMASQTIVLLEPGIHEVEYLPARARQPAAVKHSIAQKASSDASPAHILFELHLCILCRALLQHLLEQVAGPF